MKIQMEEKHTHANPLLGAKSFTNWCSRPAAREHMNMHSVFAPVFVFVFVFVFAYRTFTAYLHGFHIE